MSGERRDNRFMGLLIILFDAVDVMQFVSDDLIDGGADAKRTTTRPTYPQKIVVVEARK